jgi:exonuclease SbcD
VVISGNHDSATRLGFGGRLMEAGRVHLRSGVDDLDRPVEIVGRDGVTTLVYGLPYLEPEVVRERLGAERSHHAVLSVAMDRVRAHLDEQRVDGRLPRAVAMAHAFIAGGTVSESERDITVGGIADAPVSVFAGVDYVALGHLHRPQVVSEDPPARYSGTPLAYSFSEEGHTKSVAVVDIDSVGTVSVETVSTPVPRPLVTLRGDLMDLLADPAWGYAEEAWTRIVLTDAVRPESPMERLRTRFRHTIELGFDNTGGVDATPGTVLDPRSADPMTVVAGFIEHVTGRPADPAVLDLAGESVERLRARESA